MDLKQLLIDGCKDFNIDISDEKAEQFIKYKELLIDWNEKINLTTITDDREIIIKHFLDSISVLMFTDIKNKKVIDVGAGAGFPGIPLRIIEPSVKITLMDTLNKRVNFLNDVIENLKLQGVDALWSRAEDIGVKREYRECFDIAISRAVANLSTLSEYCLPLVKVGGSFVSLKGPEVEGELTEAANAIVILGGEVQKIEKVKLPHTDIVHSIVFIKKIKQTPTKYPRKSGKPAKEPIK